MSDLKDPNVKYEDTPEFMALQEFRVFMGLRPWTKEEYGISEELERKIIEHLKGKQ